MKIAAVDDRKDLFYIENFYPSWALYLLDNYENFDYDPVIVEGQAVRRNLKLSFPSNVLLPVFSSQACKTISKQLGQKIHLVDMALWLDMPGYTMSKHRDHLDHVKIGIQIYLSDSCHDLGTCFYHSAGDIRHKFQYKKNTGYLMINNQDQIHAAPEVVKENNIRLSAYHWATFYGQ
jgi:hypothetical protein